MINISFLKKNRNRLEGIDLYQCEINKRDIFNRLFVFKFLNTYLFV